MKKQFIFWMMISLFMVSPSFAQNNNGNGKKDSVTVKIPTDELTAIQTLLTWSKADEKSSQNRETRNQIKEARKAAARYVSDVKKEEIDSILQIVNDDNFKMTENANQLLNGSSQISVAKRLILTIFVILNHNNKL